MTVAYDIERVLAAGERLCAAKQETVADVIQAMRGRGEDGRLDATLWRAYADRLEAAWKRGKSEAEANALAVGGLVEASRKRELATAEKSLAVCDAAKLREALEFSDKELRKATEDDRFGDDPVYLVGCMRTVANVCRAALAAPTRNCDRFATLEDARKEHHKICEEYGACNKACGYKSGHSGTYQCFEAWLYAPATEQKGENNANK